MRLVELYEEKVLPHVVHFVCGTGPVVHQRRKVIPLARGKVLEVGIGTGRNLPHYDPERVLEVDGLDPSEGMRGYADAEARKVPFPVSFIGLEGERIPAQDASYDTVVITFTLCTIPEPLEALAEMRRVLRPDGRLVFCEHGLAPDESVRRWQHRLDPAWSRLSGGCHLDRDMPELLERGGFAIESLEQRYLPNTPSFFGYNFWGRAAAR